MKIKIKVIPQASKDEVLGDIATDEQIKIKTTKPAQDGEANEAVIKILAKHLQVKKSAITILSGHSARLKIVEVEGL